MKVCQIYIAIQLKIVNVDHVRLDLFDDKLMLRMNKMFFGIRVTEKRKTPQSIPQEEADMNERLIVMMP